MRAIAIVATVMALGAAPASAQNLTQEQEVALFQLFTRCEPVFPTVAVERSSEYLEEELTDSVLEEVVFTGLRSAGLLGETEKPPFLYVAVGVVHWAYVVRVELLKLVTDRETDIAGATPTWRTYRYGIHSGDPAHVVSSVGTALQRFLEDYLLVNESVCGESGDSGADSAVSGSFDLFPGGRHVREQ